jgi:hypothetical protein
MCHSIAMESAADAGNFMSDKPKIRLDTGKRLAQIRGSANQADFAVSIGVHKNTYGGY